MSEEKLKSKIVLRTSDTLWEKLRIVNNKKHPEDRTMNDAVVRAIIQYLE